MKRKRYLIFLLLIWSLGPLLFQLYTSFSSPEALIEPFTVDHSRWTFTNYQLLFSSDPPFYVYLGNSMIVASLTTIITLFFSIPAAYALSRANERINKIIYIYLLGATLFPYVLLFLSLLEVARFLNIGNNLFALCIPYSGLALPLAILLLTSAFKELPQEIEEAARIEGLNIWERLKWILIPLISPATASTSLLIFLFAWNEYPISLTWISKTDLLTLPVAIARIAGSSVYSIPYGAFAAATVIGSIPLILLVIIFQKQIISGLTQGAIKG